MKKIITLLICLVFIISGCDKSKYDFSFDEINITKECNGLDVCLEGAIFDGVSLYLHLDVNGYENTPSYKNTVDDVTGQYKGLSYYVEDYYLVNQNGEVMSGFDEKLDEYEKSNYLTENYGDTINKIVLPFENIKLDENSSYTFSVKFKGLPEITFDNLSFIHHDFEEVVLMDNNTFEYMGAECTVEDIIFTDIRTIIDVQWKIDNMKEFNENYLNNYLKNKQEFFNACGQERFFFFTPVTSPDFDYSSSEGSTITCRYSFDVVCESSDNILIKEYPKVHGEEKDEEKARVLFEYSPQN